MPLAKPFLHFMLPYNFERIENPHVKNLYLPLNRAYKPLGMTSGEFVDYRAYAEQALAFTRPLTEDEPFWFVKSDGRKASYYMYDDSLNFDTYWLRLNALMKRKHRVVSLNSSLSTETAIPADQRDALLEWSRQAICAHAA